MKTKVPGKKAGRQLFLFLLFLSECWMAVYLFFRFRYEATFPELMTELPPLPFFSVGDRWMDFFNPISYAWNLEPYTAQWGNSPPLMMLCAYFLSLPLKAGISRYAVYWGYCLIAVTVAGFALYDIVRSAGMTSIESAMLVFLSFLSFPYVYCFDRGNFVFLAAILILLFVWAYTKGHGYCAAVLLGLAAALKLYPALLGTVFLADKKFRQAFVCAITGIGSSILALLCFHGGFIWNITTFLEKSGSYTQIGNGNLGWLVDDKNSFYQLMLVPKMLSQTPLTDIWQVPDYVSTFKIGLTIFLALMVVLCLFLPQNHDRILILTMLMLGYPIESGVYNLVLAVFPLVNWCCKEQDDRVMPWLGVSLITMKSVFIIQAAPAYITWQALLNPALELAIVIYIIWLRREMLCNVLKNCGVIIRKIQLKRT